MKPWLKFTPSDIEPLKIRSLDGAKRNPGSERKQSLFSTRIPLRFIQATDSFLQQSGKDSAENYISSEINIVYP